MSVPAPVAEIPQQGLPVQQPTADAATQPVPAVPGAAADDRPPEGAPAVAPATVAGGGGAAPPPESKEAAGDTSGGASSAPRVADNTTEIRQLLAMYESAMESLNPSAVAAVYPRVNTAALAQAFRDYTSLDESITINGIDIAADGQTATVRAVLAITQLVKIGRADRVTRNVAFALRRQGDRWLIEEIK